MTICYAQVGVASGSHGSSDVQRRSMRDVLLEMVRDGCWELHLRDLGGDEHAHEFWRACRQRVVLHPSTTNQGRALLSHDEKRPALPARERDLAMADEIGVLVYMPSVDEQWEDAGVYRAARRRGLPIVVVHPSGDVHQWTLGLAPLDQGDPSCVPSSSESSVSPSEPPQPAA